MVKSKIIKLRADTKRKQTIEACTAYSGVAITEHLINTKLNTDYRFSQFYMYANRDKAEGYGVGYSIKNYHEQMWETGICLLEDFNVNKEMPELRKDFEKLTPDVHKKAKQFTLPIRVFPTQDPEEIMKSLEAGVPIHFHKDLEGIGGHAMVLYGLDILPNHRYNVYILDSRFGGNNNFITLKDQTLEYFYKGEFYILKWEQDKKFVQFELGKSHYWIDNVKHELPYTIKVEFDANGGGHLQVPMRLLSEITGADVSWKSPFALVCTQPIGRYYSRLETIAYRDNYGDTEVIQD